MVLKDTQRGGTGLKNHPNCTSRSAAPPEIHLRAWRGCTFPGQSPCRLTRTCRALRARIAGRPAGWRRPELAGLCRNGATRPLHFTPSRALAYPRTAPSFPPHEHHMKSRLSSAMEMRSPAPPSEWRRKKHCNESHSSTVRRVASSTAVRYLPSKRLVFWHHTFQSMGKARSLHRPAGQNPDAYSPPPTLTPSIFLSLSPSRFLSLYPWAVVPKGNIFSVFFWLFCKSPSRLLTINTFISCDTSGHAALDVPTILDVTRQGTQHQNTKTSKQRSQA